MVTAITTTTDGLEIVGRKDPDAAVVQMRVIEEEAVTQLRQLRSRRRILIGQEGLERRR